MNDKDFMNAISNLRKLLTAETLNFLLKDNKSHNTSELMNIIMSSHLSSLFTLMGIIKNDLENEADRKVVDNFIFEIKEKIKSIPPYCEIGEF